MRIVYYANYLVYFEVGRTEFIREYYKSYSEIEHDGYVLPVLSASLNYKSSATYDDLLTIRTSLNKFTRVRLFFDYEVYNERGTLLCTGSTEHCFTDENGKPRRMPPELWNAMKTLSQNQILDPPLNYRVVKSHETPFKDHVILNKGDKVKVREKRSSIPGWKWCTGSNEQNAWIPLQFMEINGSVAKMVCDYSSKELSVKTGDSFMGSLIVSGWVWGLIENTEEGWVPWDCLETV
ncbi:MAG: YbgC/FadM family acyl-CoA thioesterase [FCB group bacterium]|nr:YbgC/FadM family acyl-CoA thioesterase [FCB group bacterium]